MQAKEHTNLLSIFAWIYAGFQGVFVVFFLLFALLYGGMGIAMSLTAKNSELAGLVVFAVMVILFAAISVFGLVCMIANIQMGRRLRSDTPPTQKRMIVTSILNFLSWACGGVFLMPFGIALGVYGLWFALSDLGKAYLAGQPYQFPAVPPPIQPYQEAGQFNVRSHQQPDPYRWQ